MCSNQLATAHPFVVSTNLAGMRFHACRRQVDADVDLLRRRRGADHRHCRSLGDYWILANDPTRTRRRHGNKFFNCEQAVMIFWLK